MNESDGNVFPTDFTHQIPWMISDPGTIGNLTFSKYSYLEIPKKIRFLPY